MAYKKAKEPKSKAKKYPSNYGSHKSMLVTDSDYGELNDKELSFVYCEDDYGIYVTTRKVLDNGLCDFNRSMNADLRAVALDDFNASISADVYSGEL